MENPLRDGENRPVVKFNVSKDELKIYTLAKAGWYSSDTTRIYSTPVDEVMKAYDFEIMTRQYRSTALEMSKKEK